MVKLTAFLALVIPAAYVMAQDIPSGLDDLIPSDLDIPTSVPTDPAAISSYIDHYESVKTVLPTEMQSSLDSIIAEATGSLAEANGESAGSKITLGISMAVTVGIVAAAGILL